MFLQVYESEGLSIMDRVHEKQHIDIMHRHIHTLLYRSKVPPLNGHSFSCTPSHPFSPDLEACPCIRKEGFISGDDLKPVAKLGFV